MGRNSCRMKKQSPPSTTVWKVLRHPTFQTAFKKDCKLSGRIVSPSKKSMSRNKGDFFFQTNFVLLACLLTVSNDRRTMAIITLRRSLNKRETKQVTDLTCTHIDTHSHGSIACINDWNRAIHQPSFWQLSTLVFNVWLLHHLSALGSFQGSRLLLPLRWSNSDPDWKKYGTRSVVGVSGAQRRCLVVHSLIVDISDKSREIITNDG